MSKRPFRIPLLLALFASVPCAASTITVNTDADQFGSDSAHCSLREAIQAANTNAAFGGCVAGTGTDLIQLNSQTYTLTRAGRDEDDNATGDLDIVSSLVILGVDAEKTIIDGNATDRVFHVRESSPVIVVSVIDLTVRNGDAIGTSPSADANGGAFLAERQTTLSLTAVHITGNRAYQGGGIQGDNWNTTLSVTDSTFSRNSSTYLGGAIFTNRELRMTNSTVSGNTAKCTASAMLLGNFGDSTLEGVTINDNHGVECGFGVEAPAVWTSSSAVIAHVHNSIIAGNYSGPIESNCNRFQSDDYNLIGAVGDCDINGATAHTLTGFDPKLAPLFDYGGTTPTQALYPDSPAIAAGHDCRTSDQRGVARAACDIGAYAYKPTFVVNQEADAQDSNVGDGVCSVAGGHCSLRAAVSESNLRTQPTLIVLPAGTVRLTITRVDDDPNHTGELSSSAPDSLTIFGAGANATRVLGDGNEDVMFELMTGSHAIARLSVRGGSQHVVTTAGGISTYHAPLLLHEVEIAYNRGCHGGLSVGRHAILDRVSIHDNLADESGCPRNSGGGIEVGTGGEVELRNVTISRNRARDGGGGIHVEGGIARLVHVTVAGNSAGYDGTGTNADGGGLDRGSTGSIYLKNSIVTGNHAAGAGDDCSAIVQSQDFNLIGDATGCTIGGQTAGNLIGSAAGLAALFDDGDGLPVYGLLEDSPAIDGVGTDNDDRVLSCRDTYGRLTMADQRGMPRMVDSFCDIGAYEGTSDRLFVDGFAD